jgi:hypothetical protein
LDPFEDVWRSDDGGWMTTHAPPPGFDGEENREWNGFAYYQRACTPEEAALLDAHETAMIEQEQRELAAHAEADRNRFVDMLRSELLNVSGGPATPFPGAGEGLGREGADAKGLE